MLNEARTNVSLKARKDAACPHDIGVITDRFTAKAENAEIWRIEGRRLIDLAADSRYFLRDIGTIGTPPIMEIVKEQMEKFYHTCFHATMYEGYVGLCEGRNSITPGVLWDKNDGLVYHGAEAAPIH